MPPFTQFEHYTADEVAKFINNAPNKQCDLDSVPTWLAKQCCDILAAIFALMANKSFDQACFPDSHKCATVVPILKKANLDPFDLKSFRPISNLSFISKLVERLAVRRFQTHIADHNLLPARQSAYRRHHSTETAVTVVLNDIMRAVD